MSTSTFTSLTHPADSISVQSQPSRKEQAADVNDTAAERDMNTEETARVAPSLPLSVDLPSPSVPAYDAVHEALASLDREIADIDFSALLNIPTTATEGTSLSAQQEAEREAENDGAGESSNTGAPDFVDYVKSLAAAADSFDLLLDSHSDSPVTPLVNPFSSSENILQRDYAQLESSNEITDEVSAGPIAETPTTPSRETPQALLSRGDLTNETIDTLVSEMKGLEVLAQTEMKTEGETGTEKGTVSGRSSNGGDTTTVKAIPLVPESPAEQAQSSQQSHREAAHTAGGVSLSETAQDVSEDNSQCQPFPPLPLSAEGESSQPLASTTCGDVVWGSGTIVGCLLNTHTGAMSFSVNGRRVGSDVPISMGKFNALVRPVFSCTASAGLEFNIGQAPFSYQPALTARVAKNRSMVSLASLFDTYPKHVRNLSQQRRKPSVRSSVQDTVTEDNAVGLPTETETLSDTSDVDVDVDAEDSAEGELEDDSGGVEAVCKSVMQSTRSPFLRLGLPHNPKTLPVGLSSTDPSPLFDSLEAFSLSEEVACYASSEDAMSADAETKDAPAFLTDIPPMSMILIDDESSNFVFRGISLDTSVRLLPGAFSHRNTSKSVSASAVGVRGDGDSSESKRKRLGRRVICSFGLKSDGITTQCSIAALEDLSVVFIIKERGAKGKNASQTEDGEGESTELVYSTPPNSILPLAWTNISIVINSSSASKSKSRDADTAKRNISIYINKSPVSSFFCPFLNTLLESTSCDVSRIAIGGYLSSIEKASRTDMTYSSLFSGEVREKREDVEEKNGGDEREEKEDPDGDAEDKEDAGEKQEESMENADAMKDQLGTKTKERGDSLNGGPSSRRPVYRMTSQSRCSNWIGDICEFRFWVVPRSAEATYNSLGRSKICGIETDLVVCLAFQEGVGDQLYDSTLLDGCVRPKGSIIMLTEGSSGNVPQPLWGNQTTDKTAAAELNLKTSKEFPVGGREAVGDTCAETKSETDIRTGAGEESVVPLRSASLQASSAPKFLSLGDALLESLRKRLLTASENYLAADSGDVKVSE